MSVWREPLFNTTVALHMCKLWSDRRWHQSPYAMFLRTQWPTSQMPS